MTARGLHRSFVDGRRVTNATVELLEVALMKALPSYTQKLSSFEEGWCRATGEYRAIPFLVC